MNAGRLIAFEGLDGSGKSTQLERLAARLRDAGCDVVTTCEPTTLPSGQRIREMARSDQPLAPEEELRWFVEDRRVHVAEVIAPALRAGQIVLTDRYYLSTVAYQGARGLDYEQILADSEEEFPIPNLVLLLEIDPQIAFERVHARGSEIEGVFERREFLSRVASVFDALDCTYLERVPGDGALNQIEAIIAERVSVRLGLDLG
ncbi:MAG: dTMP kinase [Deltaproteobacteria bacterium]|nr:dTMP kinase [Deltaproteobacteria bacterium]MBW2694806.1 dTMP kinase [Deltaproteobacteria bacterium]